MNLMRDIVFSPQEISAAVCMYVSLLVDRPFECIYRDVMASSHLPPLLVLL